MEKFQSIVNPENPFKHAYKPKLKPIRLSLPDGYVNRNIRKQFIIGDTCWFYDEQSNLYLEAEITDLFGENRNVTHITLEYSNPAGTTKIEKVVTVDEFEKAQKSGYATSGSPTNPRYN